VTVVKGDEVTNVAELKTLLGVRESEKPGRIVVWDTEEISVGRLPENDIMLEDTDASRKHVLFKRTIQGFQVQDLGTANGTTVNKERITEPQLLSNKDVVEIGDVQITFIQTRKDPSALGLETQYASQLKGFGGPAGVTTDPGATTLGLASPAAGAFDVNSVGDFDVEPPAGENVIPRDLDLEFAEFESGAPQPSAVGGTVSLQLEIEGLTPDLQQLLQSFAGKVIELPSMRVRIKSE